MYRDQLRSCDGGEMEDDNLITLSKETIEVRMIPEYNIDRPSSITISVEKDTEEGYPDLVQLWVIAEDTAEDEKTVIPMDIDEAESFYDMLGRAINVLREADA